MSTSQDHTIRDTSDFIFPNRKIHNEGVKTQHWQLKDMLKIYQNLLIFPQSHKVYSYDLETRIKLPLSHELPFAPTSLCAKNELLAVGGGKGQLYVKNLITNEHKYYFLCENINNHIEIHEKKIYVSNNDKKLRILSIETGEIQIIDFITQVNCSCVSPNGKYLILLGDTNDVYIYEIINSEYKLIKKLKTVKDSGFCITWDNLSTRFAVASQDGFVSVWDIGSDKKEIVLSSKQQGTQKGAIRNVFFSKKNSLDLIFFTEQSTYFTAFDARSFEKRQCVKIEENAQITGAIISEYNFKIFVSTDSKIYEYDINTVSRRIFDEK